jgi:archaellum component FlaC
MIDYSPVSIEALIGRVHKRSLNDGHQAAVLRGEVSQQDAQIREIRTILGNVSLLIDQPPENIIGTPEEVESLETAVEDWIKEIPELSQELLMNKRWGSEKRRQIFMKLKTQLRSRENTGQ